MFWGVARSCSRFGPLWKTPSSTKNTLRWRLVCAAGSNVRMCSLRRVVTSTTVTYARRSLRLITTVGAKYGKVQLDVEYEASCQGFTLPSVSSGELSEVALFTWWRGFNSFMKLLKTSLSLEEESLFISYNHANQMKPVPWIPEEQWAANVKRPTPDPTAWTRVFRRAKLFSLCFGILFTRELRRWSPENVPFIKNLWGNCPPGCTHLFPKWKAKVPSLLSKCREFLRTFISAYRCTILLLCSDMFLNIHRLLVGLQA